MGDSVLSSTKTIVQSLSSFSAARAVRRHEAERDGRQEARRRPASDAWGGDCRLSPAEGAIRGREDELRASHPHPWKAREEEMKMPSRAIMKVTHWQLKNNPRGPFTQAAKFKLDTTSIGNDRCSFIYVGNSLLFESDLKEVVLLTKLRFLSGGGSVTRLGKVLKFLATFLTEEAQMIGNFLGYFEKPYYYVETTMATFWNNWVNFYSNIWSHWWGI